MSNNFGKTKVLVALRDMPYVKKGQELNVRPTDVRAWYKIGGMKYTPFLVDEIPYLIEHGWVEWQKIENLENMIVSYFYHCQAVTMPYCPEELTHKVKEYMLKVLIEVNNNYKGAVIDFEFLEKLAIGIKKC